MQYKVDLHERKSVIIFDEVKRDILNLYEADFAKIDSTGRLAMLFDAIPAQLNKNASRFQASSVLDGEKSDRILKRYLIYTKDMSKDQDIFCNPVYMVPFL